MIRQLFRQVFGGHGKNGRSRHGQVRRRHLAVEPLECRQLLSITLPTIANVTLPAGTTMFVPLAGSDTGQTVNYSVTASDYSKLTPVMTPQSNQTLEFHVNIGGVDQVMDFRLFDDLAPETTAQIESLVNQGFYNGLQIYRNGMDGSGNPFVIQGGNDPPTGAIKTDQSPIADAEEFNPDLQFTTVGSLAMARSTPGTSSTEFFITENATDATRQSLDFNYTLFGVQTAGSSVISAIAAMADENSTQDPSGLGYLQTPITITSASIITDTQNGVLELRAPTDATGTVTVTVTASDGTNTPVSQSFNVTLAADSASNPANPFASVTPTAPASVTYLPPSGTSSQATNVNNSGGSTLQFQVTGVTSGSVVEVLADGNPIGQATASGTSVVVTTDGSTKLTDGIHQFTAIQIAQKQTVTVNENNNDGSGDTTPSSQTADVPSLNSPAAQLTVDTVPPQLNFTPVTAAVIGVPYACQVTSSDASAVTYQLSQAPAGMTVVSDTGLISWTPTADQTPTEQVTVQATDLAGNTAQQQLTINVLATNSAPVLTSANPSMGTTDEDTPITISLAKFINNGSGTTTIVDSDNGAVLGGIALTAVTGNGTWQYSLDGTTFTDVGAVSESSALLLANNAELRYVPDSKNGETPTITYQAWDTTGGANGVTDDLTLSGLVGNSGPFSTDPDTASLTVASVNDAPVLTPASPSLGTVTSGATATTISLAKFINNGAGTTTIADVDNGAVVGGIALTGTTGNGTWTYSLDGTTFTAVGTVADTSALLLPSTATLQYTPAATDTATAAITYRGWDTTTGQSGTEVDTTTNGGTTAFSAATDTASLAITSGSLSGSVYLDANNDGQQDNSEPGLAGVTVRLYSQDGSGNLTEVAGVSPVQTDSAGSYSFQNLAAGTYQVEVFPASELLVDQSTLQLQLGAGENQSGHDFRVLGFQPAYISLRLFLGSTPPMTQVIQNMHAAPTVSLSGTSGTSDFAATYTTLGSPVTIASSSASISSPESPAVASMTVTIQNITDGSSEQLQAVTSGTSLQSNYANGVLTVSGVADVATYQTVLESITYSDTASSPTMTARTISVVVNDGTAQSASAVTTMTLVQGSVPSGYSITADQSAFNASTATVAGFTFAGAEVGATYAYTIGSDAGGTSVTGSGTVTSTTQDVTGINISSLPDGNLTFSVTLTNTAGIAGAAVTTTATLDQTVPASFTVAADQTALDATTATSAGFTLANAEVGTTYSYTVRSSGDGAVASVTGSGTVTSATQDVTGINVSSLPDGTITYSVALTDAAGNTGAVSIATAVLDRVAPSGYTITADQGTLNASTLTAAGFTFAGAEVGTTYAYTITSDAGGTPVTGTGTIASATQDVTSIDLSPLLDGTITYSVTLTDTVGNAGLPTTTTATLSRTA